MRKRVTWWKCNSRILGRDIFGTSNKIKLEKGDVVAVEAAPGHDIGVVTLTGRLVPLQMKKANFKADTEIKRVYRKAKPVDMEKFNEAKAKEHATMIRARSDCVESQSGYENRRRGVSGRW